MISIINMVGEAEGGVEVVVDEDEIVVAATGMNQAALSPSEVLT